MSNADLAARLSALVDQWNAYKNELGSILTQATGDVTMTDGTGKLVTLPSFPQLQSNVDALTDELTGASASAQGSRTAAGLSAGYAAQSAQDADGSATAADASASSVATQATQATTSANAAAASETSASTSATTATSAANSASSSASSAATDAVDASSYADDSASSASLAEQWADAPENTQVTPGNYSAYHWAMNAQSTVTGLLTYRGSWSAASGAYPATPRKGDFWKVTSAGTVGGVQYSTGDQIINNGSGWDKIDNTEQVTMVAGRVGAINLTAGDIAGLGTAATANSSTFATLSGATFTGGISLGSHTASSASDISGHIALYGSDYGFNTTSNTLNLVAGGAVHAFKGSHYTCPGTITASNLSGTNTGDQNLSGYMPKSGGTFTGDISAPSVGSNGVVTANTYFDSNVSNVCLRATQGGNIYLRPGGISSAYDTRIDATGNMNVTGNIASENLSGINTGDQNLSGYMPKSGGVFTGGISMGRPTASTASDLSQHIALFGSSYGFSITSGALNLVAGGSVHAFRGSNYDCPGTITASNLSGTNTGDQNLSGYMPKSGGAFTGTITAATVATTVYTVATLPAGTAGMRAFVRNSSKAISGNVGSALPPSSGNFSVPVYHDGTGWIIG